MYSSNSYVNKPAGAHVPPPPTLTESESESDSGPEPESDQEYIVEEIRLRHQLDSAPDVADNVIAYEIGSGTAHGTQSVMKPQDNIDEVPVHGPDIDPIPTLEFSSKVC